ncbi:RagB/SusD family nutrient uptake outer membrane protein [Cellulophaga sp. BC115SP]|uniref:RagB/SusD family nutrient uptake outer membrane protein n=1 Tax=Cellulophaga sp. BC115SP TaxID=2683263 RepID=UPI00141263CF|nr:RagB/SusD family nutrient uptake outer membrane protein [Cellulophaga sp. BC115SP]NBB29983.1 RagB/SusD family nutrient uptake outer membrane protein [Cellulophaga sp. BC115SP]
MKKYINVAFKNAGKTLKVSVAALMMLTVTVSCTEKELLEPTPITSLSDLQAFATPDRILAQVYGLYGSAKSGQLFGGRYLIYNEIRGENWLNVTSNGVTGLQTWNHTNNSSSNEPTNMWNAAYLAVNRANLFIEGLDKNPNVVDATTTSQYKAEARFLRALIYFSLVNTYAQPFNKDAGASLGVPLRLKGEVGSGNNNLKRSTVAEVYAQILDDLNFAEQNLPASYSSALLNTTRAHKNSAIALKTRIYLQMSRWSDVVTEANKIVSTTSPFKASTGVANALQANIASVFAAPYTTVESIFSFPMGDNDLPGTQNGLHSYYVPVTGIGDYSLNPAGVVGNPAFTATDARRTNFIKNDIAGDGGRIRLLKFPTGPVHKDFVPVIRYSEVLLNLAEAKARLAGTAVDASALALLNAVRGRSTTAYAAADIATGTALVSAILTERNIEFLGEGFRSIDLQRNLLALPAKPTVAAIPTTSPAYIWPIPQTEINVNKDCLPNP